MRRAQRRLHAHTVVRGTSQTGRDLVSRLIRGLLVLERVIIMLHTVLAYGSGLTLPKRASIPHGWSGVCVHALPPSGHENLALLPVLVCCCRDIMRA